MAPKAAKAPKPNAQCTCGSRVKYKKCCGSCRANLPCESTISKGYFEPIESFLMGGDYWHLQQSVESNPTDVQSRNVLLALFDDKFRGGDLPQSLEDHPLRSFAQDGCGRSVDANKFLDQCTSLIAQERLKLPPNGLTVYAKSVPGVESCAQGTIANYMLHAMHWARFSFAREMLQRDLSS